MRVFALTGKRLVKSSDDRWSGSCDSRQLLQAVEMLVCRGLAVDLELISSFTWTGKSGPRACVWILVWRVRWSTRIQDAGTAICHLRGYIVILQGPGMGWRGVGIVGHTYVQNQGFDQVDCLHSLPGEAARTADLIRTLGNLL